MTAQGIGGYPGLRRSPPTVAPKGLGSLSPAERARLQRLFALPHGAKLQRGAKIPLTARNKAKALVRLGIGLGKMHPSIRALANAADLIDLVIGSQGAGDPIPRDWQNANDRELIFPANWSVTYYPPSTDPANTYHQSHKKPVAYYFHRLGGAVEFLKNDSDVYPTWSTALAFLRDVHVESSPQFVVDTAVVNKTSIGEYWEYDAAPDLAGPYAQGIKTDWIATKNSGTTRPTFANPQRYTIGVGTTVVSTPNPNAVTVISPNPFLSPSESSVTGPTIEGLIGSTQPEPHPSPVIVGRPTLPPGAVAPPGRAATQPKEKERKLRIKKGKTFLKIVGAVGVATEFLDALRSAFDALPPEFKPGFYQIHVKGGRKKWVKRWNANVKQRIAAVASHWDEMDVQKFLENFALDQIEDAGWAKLGQMSGQAGAAAGKPVGFQFGPWDTAYGDLAYEAYGPAPTSWVDK